MFFLICWIIEIILKSTILYYIQLMLQYKFNDIKKMLKTTAVLNKNISNVKRENIAL